MAVLAAAPQEQLQVICSAQNDACYWGRKNQGFSP
jgi:hypothetical protein